MHPAIEVASLVKRYGQRSVVDDVSFTVHQGTVFALLGRNGAGKTTTVECIEGFRAPDQGRIRVLGVDPASGRQRIADRLGVMLQDGGAYQAATPREMLELYTRLYVRAREVGEVVALTGLDGMLDARFRTLSGGEKQRVNLALALVGTPEVLFLDEPTAGMDTAARHDTWQLISRLRGEGTTVLLTTHYLEEAELLADHVVILHEGRVVAAGTVGDITGGEELIIVTTQGGPGAARVTQALGARASSLAADRYAVPAAGRDVASVTGALAAAGISVTGVSAQRRSLEEVFVSLTGGEQ